jgi:ATP-dependent exoDNAse (exonuclease V) alpha subunit
MILEHDSVVLTRDVPTSGLVAGDVGVVVHVYDRGTGYEVEFVNFDGETIAVESVEAAAVRRVGARDVPHVREMAA